jgi:hypothetical protein
MISSFLNQYSHAGSNVNFFISSFEYHPADFVSRILRASSPEMGQ